MKKLLLLLLCVPLIGMGQEVKERKYYKDNRKPPKIKSITYYNNGKLTQELVFDSINTNKFQSSYYYENGNLKTETNYFYNKQIKVDFLNNSIDMDIENLVKNGLSKSWYENGQLREEAYFKDGNRDGLFRWYYENGQLLHKSDNLLSDGNEIISGLVKTYYPNGVLGQLEEYIDGELIYLECWDEDGNEKECK